MGTDKTNVETKSAHHFFLSFSTFLLLLLPFSIASTVTLTTAIQTVSFIFLFI